MKPYAGLDVSLETTSVCVVDEDGRVRLEAQCNSEPAPLVAMLQKAGDGFVRIGLEAGPLSQWLFVGLIEAELPAVCIEARHAKAAIGAMTTNKNDRNDARSIAQVVRSGWFKTVHVKSAESQELRTLLVSREFLVNKIRDHENEIRGSLRPHGLKVGKVGARDFEARVRELCDGRPRLAMCMEALLRTREALRREMALLHRELLLIVKNDELCRRFMSIPGVGPVTALAFKTTIDRPDRFRRSSDVGAHLGLTPRQHQSGETDRHGRITRCGDGLTLQCPVRCRERDAEPVASVDRAQGLGHAPRQAQLAEESEDSGGTEARRRHAPDVARWHALPMDGRRGLTEAT